MEKFKNLTVEDIKTILNIADTLIEDAILDPDQPFYKSEEEYCEDVLKHLQNDN